MSKKKADIQDIDLLILVLLGWIFSNSKGLKISSLQTTIFILGLLCFYVSTNNTKEIKNGIRWLLVLTGVGVTVYMVYVFVEPTRMVTDLISNLLVVISLLKILKLIRLSKKDG